MASKTQGTAIEWTDFTHRDGEKVHRWPDGSNSILVDKKQAGRQLDGRTWDEMPAWGGVIENV